MQTLHITTIYAATLAILLVVLAYRVAITRKKEKVGVGDGKNHTLIRLKAAHENAVDNIPIFLILFAVFEYNGGSSIILHFTGSLFLVARLLHAYGMSLHPGLSFGRLSGIFVSWICILSLAVLLLALAATSS
ncbi:MAG: MAPEG family protein [Gammaproteobacteria bacterium]|nr:MAPEG family protein [Gammaproteobacteria bacterium]